MKTKISKVIACIILAAAMLAAAIQSGAGTVLAASAAEDISYSKTLGVKVNKTEFNNVKQIAIQFCKSDTENYVREFPYTDELFTQPEDAFCQTFAQISLGISLGTGIKPLLNNGNADQITEAFEQMGFGNVDGSAYSEPITRDTSVGVVASKKIGKMTVIAAVNCGAGYGSEWAGNLEVGDESRHVGFNKAAQITENRIDEYIKNNNIKGEIVVWLTGFSRAAAAANIAAADLSDRDDISRVYAYCFGTPETTRDAGSYPNIFNIVGKNDPVPKIPFGDWGYTRYGSVLYTPSMEVNSNYLIKQAWASEVMMDLAGTYYASNPEIARDLVTLLTYLLVMIPDTETYVKYYQAGIMDIMDKQATREKCFEMLEDLIRTNAPGAGVDSAIITEFVDFMEELISKYVLEGNKNQMETGSWNESLTLSQNLLNEHSAEIYYCWLFTGHSAEHVFDTNTNFINILFDGDMTIEAYNEYGYIGTFVTGKGMTIDEEITKTETENFVTQLYSEFSDRQALITIPQDIPYYLKVIANSNTVNSYVNTRNTVTRLVPMESSAAMSISQKGDCQEVLIEDGDAQMSDLSVISEFCDDVFQLFTPSEIIRLQRVTKSHVTVGGFLAGLLAYCAFLLLQGIVYIILAIVRTVKKRERRTVPTAIIHLANAAAFIPALLYLKFYFPAFPVVTLIPRTIAYLCILTLSLLALRVSHSKFTIWMNVAILACAVAATVVLNFVIPTYSTLLVCVELLVALAMSIAAAFVWGRRHRVVNGDGSH